MAYLRYELAEDEHENEFQFHLEHTLPFLRRL